MQSTCINQAARQIQSAVDSKQVDLDMGCVTIHKFYTRLPNALFTSFGHFEELEAVKSISVILIPVPIVSTIEEKFNGGTSKRNIGLLRTAQCHPALFQK